MLFTLTQRVDVMHSSRLFADRWLMALETPIFLSPAIGDYKKRNCSSSSLIGSEIDLDITLSGFLVGSRWSVDVSCEE
ncbi:hypothetical protein L6452_01842 [Arctium lappa]|uniref:Uncharacterized protein n=1 Tax=Arctium lappa TaxID=4217 RepID=A0ACB9FIN6_ARCLA|nr:hypothetical protein L6452_01842 [Arctium lappa]